MSGTKSASAAIHETNAASLAATEALHQEVFELKEKLR